MFGTVGLLLPGAPSTERPAASLHQNHVISTPITMSSRLGLPGRNPHFQAIGGCSQGQRSVACHEDGSVAAGFLSLSWDHPLSQSSDRPGCCAGVYFVSLFDYRLSVLGVEVIVVEVWRLLRAWLGGPECAPYVCGPVWIRGRLAGLCRPRRLLAWPQPASGVPRSWSERSYATTFTLSHGPE